MVHPSSTAVPLLAMNAEVELTSKAGKRTVAMRDFYLAPEEDLQHETAVKPGELITAIRVPTPAAGTRSAYQKYGEKESFDWPLADAGVVLEMDGNACRKAAIVLGVAAPTPIHATEAEAALRGKTIDEQTAREAAKLPWRRQRRCPRTVTRCSSSRRRSTARYCWRPARCSATQARLDRSEDAGNKAEYEVQVPPQQVVLRGVRRVSAKSTRR